jgi:hypothetical protein
MRSSIVSKAFLAVEAAVVLTAVWIAIAVASIPPYLPCGDCKDPPPADDPHRIAVRLSVLVIGGVLAAALELIRRGIRARARDYLPG